MNYIAPTKGITKNRNGLLKHERGDLHTLKTTIPSSPENVQTSKLVKECMKHAIMMNGECTPKM